MTAIDLTHHVALVTGASRGIGQAIALSLAKADANVAIGYNRDATGAQRTAQECGKKSLMVQGDVRNAHECERITRTVVDRFGRLDIVINNAAISDKDSFAMPFEAWRDHWQKTIDINLMSAVHISYWAVEQMKKQGKGKIINVASRSAFRGETEYIAYAATKAAMVNFTRCLARTLAPQNILAYAVAPGFIETGLGMEEIERRGNEIRSQIPSGKIGTPEDVANVVLFLASPLSDYITGSTIDVNGGSYLH